jgi:hypothetical protein
MIVYTSQAMAKNSLSPIAYAATDIDSFAANERSLQRKHNDSGIRFPVVWQPGDDENKLSELLNGSHSIRQRAAINAIEGAT